MANKYALQPFNIQLSGGASVFVDAGAKFDSASAICTGATSYFTAVQTIGATTVASVNTNPVPVSITVSGGTVTVIAINGANTGQTSGTFTVPAGGSITITYSVGPTFTQADIPPSAGYPGVNGVHAGYLAVYPSGPSVS